MNSPGTTGDVVDGTPQVVERYPLTPTQQGILFNSLRAGGGLVEIEQIVCRLEHALDIPRLRASWQWASERHAALRTSFRWSDGEPAQEVVAHAPIPFEARDHARVPAPEREAQLARFLEEDRERGFDLGHPPLTRLTLFTHGPFEHVLVWTFHHAVLDGRSFTAVLREVFERYDGAGRPAADPPPFRLHCEHLARRDTEGERAFWTEHLRGFGSPTPVPAARVAREAHARRRHAEVDRRVGTDAVTKLLALGAERGFTLANAVQGAWALVLARYARVDDVCFGTTRAARHTGVPGALEMVGCLINTVPLRVRVREDDSLDTFLRGLREWSVAVRPHEQASLASMRGWASTARHDASGDGAAPLFDTLVVFERYLMDAELRALGGAWVRRHFAVLEQSDFPIVLAAYQDGSDLILRIEHDPMRCDAEAVAALLGHLVVVLRAMAERPDALLRELPMLRDDERTSLLALAGGDGPLVETGATGWVASFAEQVRARPDAIAIAHDRGELTYAELERAASAIGSRLAGHGIRSGDVVAVCVKRSPLLAASLVGVLRSGAVYLPIDPAWPHERIALLLEDADARLVITQRVITQRVSAGALPDELLERALIVDDLEGLHDDARHDDARRDDARHDDARRGPAPAASIDPESPAYLLYTSGSTGRPKGVLVPHRALFAHARAIVPAFELDPRDRCLQFTSASFDVSLEEMLPTWLAGATVVLRSEAAATSMDAFLRELERQRITVANVPSAFFTEVALHSHENRVSLPSRVRLVIVGGEKPSAVAYAAWRRRHPHCRFLNAYGPTEVTITSTICDPEAAQIPADGQTDLPIGRALGATRAYVLDERGDLAPLGVVGELCLAGPQVALGYLGRAELTAQKFVPCAFSGPGPMYRTGDLARWLPGHQLELVGRIDDQVKIRGFRIEPGEIEALLRACPGVRDAVVAARPLGGGSHLVAWIVAGEQGRDLATPAALQEALAKRLPSYMVPRAFSILDALPLAPSGKIDKRALPEPIIDRDATRHAVPDGDLEEWLASLFCELLGRDEVSAEDSFFDLGGHSLLAVRLLSRINARAKEPLDLGVVFARPTVRELARALDAGGSASVPTLVVLNRADPSSVPFFCVCGVRLYARLARAMEADRPVYGSFLPVEADALLGANGDRTQLDVRALASAYLELLREQRPHGPYLLGGLSFGGILAYEMAQQLRARGETVSLLVLFDAILPRALHRLSASERARVHVRRLAGDPRAALDHFADRARRHVARLTGFRVAPPPRDEGPSSITSIDLLRDEIFRRAAEAYDPLVRPYDGRIVLFQSRDGTGSETERVDWDRGWTGLVPVNAAMHTVSGSHMQILQEPGVFEIARVLRTHLRDVDERPPMRRTRRVSSARIVLGGRPTPTDL